jgi:hypothetical protein
LGSATAQGVDVLGALLFDVADTNSVAEQGIAESADIVKEQVLGADVEVHWWQSGY